MGMDAKEFYKACLKQTTKVIRQLRTEQFGAPTPDTEWTVRDLVSHMLYELSWVPDLVEGKSIAEVGRVYDGDLFGDTAEDLSQNWQAAAERAEAAVDQCNLTANAHLSYADVTNEEYLRQAGSDEFIHAWDLAKAIVANANFDSDLIQEVYAHGLTQEVDLRASGLFGDPISVPDNADQQTKLLALYGRRADWQAPVDTQS